MAPGIPDQPLNLAISNPNNQVLPITNLERDGQQHQRRNGLRTEQFRRHPYSGPYPLNVPAGAASATLSSLGVPSSQQPQLKMIDLPTNQDACKGVTVNLSYSGSAQGK